MAGFSLPFTLFVLQSILIFLSSEVEEIGLLVSSCLAFKTKSLFKLLKCYSLVFFIEKVIHSEALLATTGRVRLP